MNRFVLTVGHVRCALVSVAIGGWVLLTTLALRSCS